MKCKLGFRDIAKQILIFPAVWYAICPNLARSQLTIPAPLDELNAAQKRAVNDYVRKNERPTGELRILAQRNQIVVRSSKVLRELFPQYRFVAIPWSYQVSPEAKDRYQIPGWLFDVLTLDATGATQCVFHNTGNQEEYGEFLKTTKITLANDQDAAHVASAIAEIRGGGSSSRNVRHSESEWYLGYQESPFRAISGSEEIREAYYFRVRLDSRGAVLGGRLESEILERRPIPSSKN